MQHIDIFNRVQIIKWLCLIGNELCRNVTTKKLEDIASISADLREVVVCAGIRGANADMWSEINVKCQEEDHPLIEKGLSCSENVESLEM